jgi:hypothetical protein
MGLYNAEVSAGSLMLPESRKIAAFLLTGPDEAAWTRAFSLEENLLQKNKPATARRMARLIRNRLEPMGVETLKMIAEGEKEVATQLLMACSIRHSRLLGDFMLDVYRRRLRSLEKTLDAKDWGAFLDECAHRDSTVTKWSASTKAKIFQVVVRILAEAGYLDSTRRMGLTPPMLHPTSVRHLKKIGADDVLAIMETPR